ncbi:LOB domain-containing protein [Striga asiatica]|uniref:LOB domain-containing protein n=1 Tax=Striga asiatica TaxID=4170 RepID=A0A5A7Q8N5_STRAF|nr:LOB domain-containing protein [Striga asiatica]
MTNRNNENDEPSNHPACAACKNQRKKCAVGCLLRPHFPASEPEAFAAVHKVFGVANVTKMLREAQSPADQYEIARSLHWESAMWVRDPVRGPYGLFARVQDENQALREHANRQRLLLSQFIGPGDPRGNYGNSMAAEPEGGPVAYRPEFEPGFVFQQQLDGNVNLIRRPLVYGPGGPVGQFGHFVGPQEGSSMRANQEFDYGSWPQDQNHRSPKQEKFQ